jgi:hypothetical protein
MRRLLCALLCVSSLLFAANFKLYLMDGNFHVVREYKVEGDRVKYYSVERGDWEEIPATLVDLKKTEGERSARAEAQAEEAKLAAEEDQAIRSQKIEITKIPQDPGVYSLDEKMQLRIFQVAESKAHNSKGRMVLKVLAPIPIVPGKSTIELDGERSTAIIKTARPDLFIQLSAEERFSIIKLTPAKGVRIAERLTVIPVSKEVIEEMDEIEIFRKQLTESGLFKIWPVNPLEPGEYAVIQYTSGKVNAQLWDFAYRP